MRARNATPICRLAEALKQQEPQLQELQGKLLKGEVVNKLRENLDSGGYGELLRRCGGAKALDVGRMVHRHILKRKYEKNTFLGNLLVQMYGNCGSLHDARDAFTKIPRKNTFSWNILIAAFVQNGRLKDAKEVFDQMQQQQRLRGDVVSWTTMITAYAQNGHPREAMELFRRMDLEGIEPDRITFVGALDACGSLEAVADGEIILQEIPHREGFLDDVVVATSVVDMYGKCKRLHEAASMFNAMTTRNVVSWTAMLDAYAFNRDLKMARDCFDKMPERSLVSWIIAISAHAHCGDMQQAENLARRVPQVCVAAWTILIAVSAHNGQLHEALRLLQQMDLDGISPDKVTIINFLDACAKFSASKEALLVQSSICDTPLLLDARVGTALITFHGKCGRLVDVRKIFDFMCSQASDVALWTATMAAYARNGLRSQAMSLFREMQLQGIDANRLTFTIVLFLCSHAGLVRDGRMHFWSMVGDHGLTPDSDHYIAMVDLLGRAGEVGEARELINNMPFLPDQVALTALLGASKVYGDSPAAAHAGNQMMELGPQEAAPYVLLSSVCAC